MSYTMCPACGQHALKVANRCPRCGLPFEQQFLSRSQPDHARRRVPVALLLGGVLVLMLGTAEWINRRKGTGARPAVTASRESVATRPEHRPPASAGLAPPTDGGAQPPVKPPTPAAVITQPAPAVEMPRPRATTPPAAAPVGDRSHAATTWVNVRARPNSASPVVGVLQPGEVVQVDSTTQGWYRVQAGRVPTGYVDRRLLESRRQ
jgi:uncharacterized protein YgiM (DUF1202 family)